MSGIPACKKQVPGMGREVQVSLATYGDNVQTKQKVSIEEKSIIIIFGGRKEEKGIG